MTLQEQTTIVEGNKLIALFMGWEEGRFENLPNKLHRIDTGQLCGIHIDNLEYHASWDWLMPVIKKIELFENEESAFVVSMPLYTPIETVWKAVIEFIKWYNNQFTKKDPPYKYSPV